LSKNPHTLYTHNVSKATAFETLCVYSVAYVLLDNGKSPFTYWWCVGSCSIINKLYGAVEWRGLIFTATSTGKGKDHLTTVDEGPEGGVEV
jgi:hypothetical protein